MNISILKPIKNHSYVAVAVAVANVTNIGIAANDSSNYEYKGIPIILQQTLALLVLLIMSPLLLLVILLIKTESAGCALFSQTRVGENGRHFKMYKFRSMYLKSDPRYKEPDPLQSSREGICKKYINDSRITKFGQFIRK